MRIHKLIPLLALLVVLALTTIPTIKHSLMAVEQGTISAQAAAEKKVKAQPGTSAVQATAITTEQRACDLYLDAAEVERRAKEAQSQIASQKLIAPSKVPISFEDVVLPVAGGIDHVVAGVATRNSGSGVIRLRGVPPGAQLVSALLVWGEITNTPTSYNINFGSITTTPATFTGSVYGTTAEPCWFQGGQYAGYITNVTTAINAGINGDYLVKNLRSAVTDGRCAWFDTGCEGLENELPLSEGASLIVMYTHECIPSNAQLYIHLGPTMFATGTHTVTHSTLPPILPGLGTVKHSRIGGDGQVSFLTGAQGLVISASCGLHASPETSDERTWIINSLGNSIQIKGDGSTRNRDSDWNGDDGEPMNKLWDTHSDVIFDSNLAGNGGLNYSVKYQSQGDCIVWGVHILGVR